MTSFSSFPRLLGDVGGTNARFGWQAAEGAPVQHIFTYACAEHATLLDALRFYLHDADRSAPRSCCIGIATAVLGDDVKMTNHHWSFSTSRLAEALGVERMLVINDFTALALSLLSLSSADLRQVGGTVPVPDAPIALLGPGTGLGVSGLLRDPSRQDRVIPLQGEGGHVTLAAANEEEEAVVRELRRRFGHASAERALSGPGLVNIYLALCTLSGEAPRYGSAAEITDAAAAGADALCVRTERMFLHMLGGAAGSLALTLGARGGVYIGGGIVPRIGPRILDSDFRAAFEHKGRYRAYLGPIPVYVVDAVHPPALLGASCALDCL